MVSSLRTFAHSASLVALSGCIGVLAACSSEDSPGPGAAGSATVGGTGGSVAGTSSGGSSGAAATAGSATSDSGASGSGGNSVGGAGGAGTGGAGTGGAGGNAGGASGGSAGVGGVGGMVPDVSSEGDGDSEIGPDYTKDPDLADQKKTRGKKFTFTMKIADSKIFDGKDSTLNKPVNATRSITVYVPALYKDGTDAPVLVIQDGPGPIDKISYALDNLTVSTDPLKKLPPFIAVAVQNGGSDAQGSERGLEYDTMSDRYSRFIDTEVLPAVVADAAVKAAYPGLKFTKDPQGRGAFGCSSGGAAALSMGWFATHLWSRIITYSGTFVDQQNHAQPEAMMMNLRYGAWEYHSDAELIKNADNKPLRIFLNVNENDNGAMNDEASHHNWVMANERTAEDLAAKKYHYKYVFGKGAGHCDGKVQDATIAKALSWAWRGYVYKG